MEQKSNARRVYTARIILVLVLLFPLRLSAQLFEFSGKVVRVSDGDTITVLHVYQGKKIGRKIRLWGIDCPERQGQAFGLAAKKFTSQLVYGKKVAVHVEDVDHYGRLVAQVNLLDGTGLNLSLVRAGLAWWYKKYAPKALEISRAQAQAKQKKAGLWSQLKPQAPWDWRHFKKKKKHLKKLNKPCHAC